MRSAATAIAALSASVGAVLTGCSSAPADAPPVVHIAEAAKPSPARALNQILPTVDELAGVLGVAGFMGQLVDGGPDMLLQSVSQTDASPSECLGTGYRLQKAVYQSSPVHGVASQSWAGGDASGPTASGFFGAVEFANPDAAQAFFADAADNWHRCNGETLALHQGERGAQGASRISTVMVDNRIVSAVVIHDDGSTAQRALGVGANRVVDVEVSKVAGAPNGAGDAVAVANLMLQKNGAA
jgi:hypothetical protein